jgi:asparagine synthase (glutamine-hydrolysing)
VCRIVGFWDFKYGNDYPLDDVVVRMRETLIHGGPDDAGAFTESESGLALAHRRLSIIDLSSQGHQPMHDGTRRFWITYNGEVYNYQEIRDELLEMGHTFRSHTDTEVILKGFQEWGLESVKRFRGMFAFAIWDSLKKELFLCRDRAGVKPLYWYYDGRVFMFASELKALHSHPGFSAEIDRKALATYFAYGYIQSPFCIFRHTHKLEPGHFLHLGRDQKISKLKYWDINDSYLRGEDLDKSGYWSKRSERETAEELVAILSEGFKYRMIADVPVGVFLSGGIDSSVLVALLAAQGFNLRTFTIGFPEQAYNEAQYAKKVADHLGTDHTELMCTPKDASKIIPLLPEIYDEPFGDSSAIPTYLVSSLARQHVTVSLSADGGDELFCGYNAYPTYKRRITRLARWKILSRVAYAMRILRLDKGVLCQNLSSLFGGRAFDFTHEYVRLFNQLGAKTPEELCYLSERFSFKEDLATHGLPDAYPFNSGPLPLDDYHIMMQMDFKNYLPDDVLAKVDRASMAVALESREPFLDTKIIEFVASLPASLKVKDGVSKYILKEIVYRHIPKELLDRPKMGFGVPIATWFEEDLRELFADYLSEDRIRREGYLNPSGVASLVKHFRDGNNENIHRLWHHLMFEMWLERWMEG